MTHGVTLGIPLAEQTSFRPLFRDWLRGGTDLGSAAGEWRRYVNAAGTGRIAPAFFENEWIGPWWTSFRALLPDARSLAACRENLELLRAGKADIVVTGQQPAAMGGPLYTVFKIASAIEAARWRTEAGHPTVPIFWLGDDDPDLTEALAPRIHDPRRDCFLAAADQSDGRDCSVGAMPARAWEVGTLTWLKEQGGSHALARAMRHIWFEALRDRQSLAVLYKRFILRLFLDSGLLIVSGSNGNLHATARPIYERIVTDLDTLRQMARRRGAELAEAGWHAQISDRSLDHPLRMGADDRNRRIATPDTTDGTADLRPGVMLRSIVQDWLFRPLAVVVGPAELAYLKQIEPMYREVGLTRPALLPRLFGNLSTAYGEDRELEEEQQVESSPQKLAEEALEPSFGQIARYLEEDLGMEPADARNELKGLRELLTRRAAGFLKNQIERARPEAPEERDPWLNPQGKRQERVMSSAWAAAIWGDPLLKNIRLAAYAHYKRGAAGDWLDTWLSVSELPLIRGARP